MLHRSHLWLSPNPFIASPRKGKIASLYDGAELQPPNSNIPAHHHSDTPLKSPFISTRVYLFRHNGFKQPLGFTVYICQLFFSSKVYTQDLKQGKVPAFNKHLYF